MNDTTEHHNSNSLNAPPPSNSQSNDLLNLLDSLYPKGSLGEQRFHEALKNQEELKNILIEIEKLPQEKRYELLMQIGQAKQRIMEAYAHSFLGYIGGLEHLLGLCMGGIFVLFAIYFVFLRTSKNTELVESLKTKLKLQYFYYAFGVGAVLFFGLETIRSIYELYILGIGSTNDKVLFVLKNICFMGMGYLIYKVIKVIGIKNFINGLFASKKQGGAE
ncbi:cag pathogenicity island translocation protein CagU [Helicobacter pylori]